MVDLYEEKNMAELFNKFNESWRCVQPDGALSPTRVENPNQAWVAAA
jgi:hypothetical protein